MWPLSLLFGRGDKFCRNEFKDLWSGFVDAYTDSINAKGPAACPPRSADVAPQKLQARFPAAKRLVAFGDIHGDLAQMKSAFMAAGVVDKNLRWCGGKTVAVQVGFHIRWRCMTWQACRPVPQKFTTLQKTHWRSGWRYFGPWR